MIDLTGKLQAVGSLKAVAPKLDELKNATTGIETMFMKNLLTEMHKGMKTSLSGDDSNQSEIYQDMMDQALAEGMGKSGSLGIASSLYKNLAPKVMREAQAELSSRSRLATIDIQK